jgi:hypothetical protein
MELLHLNGIDALTGDPLVPSLDLDAAARLARVTPRPAADAHRTTRALPYGLTAASLADCGWALVAPHARAAACRDALAPLVEHRRREAGPLLRLLDVHPDESVRAWLARHGLGPTAVDPELVPYYLLLVGDPTEIPYEFQYALATRYCVGRLALDLPALATYATSVVRAETSPPRRRHHVAYWAPRHDPATTLGADSLVAPLHAGTGGRGATGRPPHLPSRATASLDLAAAATRARLLDHLTGRSDPRPALVFTASHGLGFPAGHPRQRADQGALLAADWPGYRCPDRDNHCVAADHIDDDADLAGLVAFMFACFGAGTPAADDFLRDLAAAPAALAPAPFISALPTRLLGHPSGGALAVVGHVERAWGYSIALPAIGAQLGPFHNFIARLLDGLPIGLALRDFAERHAILSGDPAARLSPPTPPS